MKEGQPLARQTWVPNTFPSIYPNSELRSRPENLNFYRVYKWFLDLNQVATLFFAVISMGIQWPSQFREVPRKQLTPSSHKVVGHIMNLISGTNHSRERRKYAFIYTLELLNNHSTMGINWCTNWSKAWTVNFYIGNKHQWTNFYIGNKDQFLKSNTFIANSNTLYQLLKLYPRMAHLNWIT